MCHCRSSKRERKLFWLQRRKWGHQGERCLLINSAWGVIRSEELFLDVRNTVFCLHWREQEGARLKLFDPDQTQKELFAGMAINSMNDFSWEFFISASLDIFPNGLRISQSPLGGKRVSFSWFWWKAFNQETVKSGLSRSKGIKKSYRST